MYSWGDCKVPLKKLYKWGPESFALFLGAFSVMCKGVSLVLILTGWFNLAKLIFKISWKEESRDWHWFLILSCSFLVSRPNSSNPSTNHTPIYTDYNIYH